MAYSETLAARIRELCDNHPNIVEKKMFGGLAFMAGGNMFCGIQQDDLILRLDKTSAAKIVADSGLSYFDFTGKPMKTMVVIPPENMSTKEALKSWVDRSLEFANSLPPK